MWGYDVNNVYKNLSEDEQVAANSKAYSTPSGSNFGSSVTGAQDIYDDNYTNSEWNFDTPTNLGRQDDYGTRGSYSSGYSSPQEEFQSIYDSGGIQHGTGQYEDLYGRYSGSSPSSVPVSDRITYLGESGGGYPSGTFGSSSSSFDQNLLNRMLSAWNTQTNPGPSVMGSSSGGGGSSGGSSGGGGVRSATQAVNTYPLGKSARGNMPAMPEMPTFAAPTRDEGRINTLTKQKSAAGLRAMRAQIQKAMGQGYRNPNVKRMTLRDALAGYGQGIENVMSGAQSEAENAYNKEYNTQYDTAAKNWQANYNTKLQDWNNKIKEYLGQ